MRMSDHTHPPTDPQAAPGGLERVRQLVNTLDLETGEDVLAGPGETASWLIGERLLDAGADPLSRSEWQRVIGVREALRALVRANGGLEPDPDALTLLDDEAKRGHLTVRFSLHDGIDLVPSESGLDGALARLFAILHAATVDGGLPLLKICGNDACQWAFFDHSKNHSRVWCKMASCGNRLKARAYRERKGKGLAYSGSHNE